nr:uncharacterized protein LOC105319041 isoform X2 [Crassostrea gigas]
MSFEWPLYIIAAKLVFVYMDCGGIYNFPPCCVGEKWDKSKNVCTKCPRGVYGDNCTHSCKVPYFGHRCVLGACKCNRVSCKIPTQICFPTTASFPSVYRHFTCLIHLSSSCEKRRGDHIPKFSQMQISS